MKKLLFLLIGLLAFLVIIVQVVTSSINEVVTKEDLPQAVYQSSNPSNGAQSALQNYFGMNNNDDYSNIELFMNYMIYDSIKENLNAEYDPLGECETEACKYIIVTDYATIDYAYATLNEEDQIILTVSIKRFSYPTVETAIHLVFDLSVNQLGTSFTLTLNHARIADKEISMNVLDMVMSYVDKRSIEESITFGELDLDNYTYTVSLLSLNIFSN